MTAKSDARLPAMAALKLARRDAIAGALTVLVLVLVLVPVTVIAQPTRASAPIRAVRYELTADHAALATRRLGVTMTFDVSGTDDVLLALPAWNPGRYAIANFARWVSGFGATQGVAALGWNKRDPDTWRIRPVRAGRVEVHFFYLADTLDTSMSWARPDFALVNGANVFPYPAGQSLDFASTVMLHVDPEALVATGLTRSGSARTYTAASYHELVDMPLFIGRFDIDSAPIGGMTFRLATYPAGAVSGTARAGVWGQLTRIVPAEVAVLGEMPWDSYTVMQIVDSTNTGYSGLEHGTSHVDVVTPQFVGGPDQPALYAHEISHAWNVKRLRPADLVPYRYDRIVATPWLWVSEGITDYYADLAQVRGGIVDATGFYALTATKIGEIAATAPFALEDASRNRWIHPKDGTETSYYPKGSLAGLMLDVLLRDATDNRTGLDAVMRRLYERTYKHGKGFTHADFWGAASRAARGRSFADFERRFVSGRDPYPWPDVLKAIGLRLVADSVPRIGIRFADAAGTGRRIAEVFEGGSLRSSGVRPGDVLVSMGGVLAADTGFVSAFRQRYQGQAAGLELPVEVKRGSDMLRLSGSLAYYAPAPRLVVDSSASPRAVRIRNGILRGVVDR